MNKKANKNTNTNSSDNKDKFSLVNYGFKINEFAMRGLNKYKNFLTAPECECGCGGKGLLLADNDKDLYDILGSVLYDNGCGNSAVFIVHKDGKQEVIHCHEIWNEESDEADLDINVLSPKSSTKLDNDFFAQLDADMCLHCYGLVIEREKGQWEICE